MALTLEEIAAIRAQRLAIINEPQSVETDAGKFSMGSLSVRLAYLDKLLADDAAANNPPTSALGGMVINKAIPPGAA